jgi:beta-lactamase regulating signal transducer with metallopeptidase domain
MSFLTASAFLKALGWALLNSIWQFAICWLLYRILFSTNKKLAAAVKHTIALSLLFLGSIFFIAELSWKFYDVPLAVLPVMGIENSSLYNNWHMAGNYIDALMPYWSLLYLASIFLLFFKLCFFVRRASTLQNTGITKLDINWRIYLKNVAAQLGIQKEVKAFLSVQIDTPQVIGFFKPVVLIPAACIANLSTEQLEAVLLHELVHIKRNDYLVNIFVASVEILFFFNPFVKQITASIRKEREYSCDDMVIQFQYHPGNYASALLLLEKNRLIPVTYGIAASGKDQKQLLTRIERIVGIKNKPASFYHVGVGLIVLLLLGIMAGIHPVKSSFDTFGPITGFVSSNIDGQQFPPEVAGALITHKSSQMSAVAKPVKQQDIAAKNNLRHVMPSKTNDAEDMNTQMTLAMTAVTAENDENDDNNATTAAAKETRDFSLTPKDAEATYITPEATSSYEPYVPSSSFSFQVIQDSSMPKVKGETYSEHKAHEAVIRTQKAIAEINWQKIEKSLKVNKAGMAKLKKELTVQMQNLNWSQINNEVQNQLSREQMEKLQETVRQSRVIQQYQQNEAYLEALQKHLNEQAQVIKVSDERLQGNLKTAEQQQKKLLVEMRKRRIIYL